ncbi:ABC transporter ATP-binding protein [Halorussus caseinilyticus]|uniref:ABC transporter ATP-binding protein n=1 Tax=Halorussus caseinilyticus TaxID=3034025 RepID=A0ABD5WN95_9EURY|nr:ABC transporter ATP-binding protein [Halorussus sp. DT72]
MTDETLGGMSDREYPLVGLVREFGASEIHHLVAAVLARTVSTFLSFADVFLIGLGIDALFNGREFAIPLLPSAWVPSEPLPLLAFITGLMFGLNVLTNLTLFVAQYGFGVFTQRILHQIRVAKFDTAQRLELGFFEENRTGNIISVLNDDVNELDGFLNTVLSAAIWISMTVVSAFVYMSALNWQLALLVLASAPVVAGVNYWFSRRLEPLKDEVRTERGALNARLETNLSGIDVIKSFTAEEHERKRVEDASLDYFDARLGSRRRAVQQSPANRLIMGVWLVATLSLGIYWIVVEPPLFFSGTLTAGQLVPFLFYMERLTLPLKNLSGVIDGYKSAKASAKRIDGLTSIDGRLEGDSGDELVIDGGRVEFENVEFGYPGTEQRVFDGISFAAESEETIGLVGSTGAGKSTLVKCLLRFHEVDDGRITIDGQDVRNVSLEDLRDAIGYVNQDAYLFDGTIRDNIAYGASDASDTSDVPDERIEAAAKTAGAHRFVTELPDGYETQVGDRGTSLSGGQRQRLAIARAIVDDPPILVFDEATSHVDNETELVLQEKLDELTEDRTTFIIAHRLSTVRGADEILVLEDGSIAERGTHERLVERDGTYATLWNVQVGNLDALSSLGEATTDD